jgi:hypothetical protein
MCHESLKENFESVEKNKDKLLKEYLNKYLLVWHKGVVGSFDTYKKAAGEGVKKYGIDEDFLVYHLLENEPLVPPGRKLRPPLPV